MLNLLRNHPEGAGQGYGPNKKIWNLSCLCETILRPLRRKKSVEFDAHLKWRKGI